MNPLPTLLDGLAGVRMRLLPRRHQLPGGYRRIYHYHLRKTAGTSLDSAFWGLAGLDLKSRKRRLVVQRNGLGFVNHKKALIERGDYFYASSHLPAHELRLPEETFTITILRDPLARLLSHYRMLLWARADARAPAIEPFWKGLRRGMEWLGASFGDFLDRIPRERLLNQLFMFSPAFHVEEAAARILSCSAVCHTESLAGDLAHLAARLELPLQNVRERSWTRTLSVSPSPSEVARARELLEPEFLLLERIRQEPTT